MSALSTFYTVYAENKEYSREQSSLELWASRHHHHRVSPSIPLTLCSHQTQSLQFVGWSWKRTDVCKTLLSIYYSFLLSNNIFFVLCFQLSFRYFPESMVCLLFVVILLLIWSVFHAKYVKILEKMLHKHNITTTLLVWLYQSLIRQVVLTFSLHFYFILVIVPVLSEVYFYFYFQVTNLFSRSFLANYNTITLGWISLNKKTAQIIRTDKTVKEMLQKYLYKF